MKRKSRVLLVLMSLMSIVILSSNFMATKIWSLFGYPVDGGFLFFPLVYILGDMLMEIYGSKVANYIALVCAISNLLAVAMLGIVSFLPPHPSYGGQAHYSYIFSFAFRITIGSLVSYLLSQLTNNYVFLVIKKAQIDSDDINSVTGVISKGYKIRALGSSVIARMVDSFIFETIAFLGVLPPTDFFKQAFGAYVLGMCAEMVIALTISEPIIVAIKKYTEMDDN